MYVCGCVKTVSIGRTSLQGSGVARACPVGPEVGAGTPPPLGASTTNEAGPHAALEGQSPLGSDD